MSSLSLDDNGLIIASLFPDFPLFQQHKYNNKTGCLLVRFIDRYKLRKVATKMKKNRDTDYALNQRKRENGTGKEELFFSFLFDLFLLLLFICFSFFRTRFQKV